MRVWEHEQDKQQADKTKEKAQVRSAMDRYGPCSARGQWHGCPPAVCVCVIEGRCMCVVRGVVAAS